MINTKTYISFIKNTIKTDGYKVADAANKIALRDNAISVETYGEAAKLIAKAYLATA